MSLVTAVWMPSLCEELIVSFQTERCANIGETAVRDNINQVMKK